MQTADTKRRAVVTIGETPVTGMVSEAVTNRTVHIIVANSTGVSKSPWSWPWLITRKLANSPGERTEQVNEVTRFVKKAHPTAHMFYAESWRRQCHRAEPPQAKLVQNINHSCEGESSLPWRRLVKHML